MKITIAGRWNKERGLTMYRSEEITNEDDQIDSRQVLERIKELREEREEAGPDQTGELPNEDEFNSLVTLIAELEENFGKESVNDGLILIRDSYFEEYAQEYAEEFGLIDKNIAWPYTCIDWGVAAEELQQDYTSFDFDGVDYWVPYLIK